MHWAGAFIVGALPFLIATAGYADTPQISGTARAPIVLPDQIGPDNNPEPLWTIDGLPVRIWAPVPPPYDAGMDRNGAADPLGSQQ